MMDGVREVNCAIPDSLLIPVLHEEEGRRKRGKVKLQTVAKCPAPFVVEVASAPIVKQCRGDCFGECTCVSFEDVLTWWAIDRANEAQRGRAGVV